MAKVTLTDLGNLQNEISVVNTINNNNARIEEAMENTLSRDGTSPNEMNADLDMNNHRIYNLPRPVNLTEPLRLTDLGGDTNIIVQLQAETIAAAAAAQISADNAASSADNADAAAVEAQNILDQIIDLGIAGGSENIFDTIAIASAASYSTAPESILVRFFDSNKVTYSTSRYLKVALEPSHTAKFSITVSGSPVWYELQYTGYVTPEQFGARRNGVNNDRTAVQNAGAYLTSKGGGTIKFGAGSYYLSLAIDASEGVTYSGSGHELTSLVGPTDGTSGSFFLVNGKSRVTIEGFSMTGDRGLASPNSNVNAITLAAGSNNITIRHNRIVNTRGSGIFSSGIVGTPTYKIHIHDNRIIDAYWGIVVWKSNSWVWIQRNIVENIETYAIVTDDATDTDNPSNPSPADQPAPSAYIWITDNYVYNAASSGFAAGINITGSYVAFVTNNLINYVGPSVGGRGISISSGQAAWNLPQRITVSGNIISSIFGNGLVVQAGAFVNITGNNFVDIDAGGGTGASMVYLINNSGVGGQNQTSNLTISGNTFNGVVSRGQAGVTINSGVTDTWIGANSFILITTEVNNLGGTSNKKYSYTNA